MQGFIQPEIQDIVRKKANRIPGKMSAVAKAAGLSKTTMYSRLRTGNFTCKELRGMDSVLHFTKEEKEVIWYGI